MNRFDKRHHRQHTGASRRHAPPPAHWRVGNASVSTEELRSWQLGPARVDRWIATDGVQRRAQE